MPSTKEIRGKIKSVQNTRKITKAMEMVAASKMRKAQDRMFQARPYGDKIRVISSHLARANVSDYKHPFLVQHEGAKRVGLILVSTDKGLAGALNTNIQRLILQRIKGWTEQGIGVDATAIGNKGLGFLQRLGVPVISQVVQLGDRPNLDNLIGAISVQIEAFKEGKVDVVYLAYSLRPQTPKNYKEFLDDRVHLIEVKNFDNWIEDSEAGKFGSGASEKIWLVNPENNEKGIFKI